MLERTSNLLSPSTVVKLTLLIVILLHALIGRWVEDSYMVFLSITPLFWNHARRVSALTKVPLSLTLLLTCVEFSLRTYAVLLYYMSGVSCCTKVNKSKKDVVVTSTTHCLYTFIHPLLVTVSALLNVKEKCYLAVSSYFITIIIW